MITEFSILLNVQTFFPGCKMCDLITDLKKVMNERALSPEDVSKFVGCSFAQVYRWLRGESFPTLLYRRAIARAIKKMEKIPHVNLGDLAKSDRQLYRKLKEKITHREKDWLFGHPENYSIYHGRLEELAKKYNLPIEESGKN